MLSVITAEIHIGGEITTYNGIFDYSAVLSESVQHKYSQKPTNSEIFIGISELANSLINDEYISGPLGVLVAIL